MNKTLDRSKKPSPYGEIKFKLPQIERFRLKNDLNVLFVRKGNLPVLRFTLIAGSGSKFDPTGKKGLANLFARVLDEGAGDYNAFELSEEMDILGSSFNISCFNDNVHLTLQTLTENLDRSLELFGTIISQPHLDEKSFEREKRKTLTQIQQIQDSPEDIADIAFDRIIFGEENPYAYSSIGSNDDVSNLSQKDVKSFYENNFLPGNSTLIIVGDSTKNELEKKLNKYLSEWKSTKKISELKYPSRKVNLSVYLIHKEGSVQTEIRIGHLSAKRDNEKFFAKHLLNLILGGQFSSRINLNLREKHGYTYGAHSRISYYQHSGFFQVSTSVGIENSVNALSEIFKELIEIRNGVSQTEVDFAKDTITKRFPLGFETYGQISQNIKTLLLHDLEYSYFSEYVPMITKVETEEINREAIDLIKPDEMAIVLVGDKEKIGLKELAKFNREINALEFDELLSL